MNLKRDPLPNINAEPLPLDMLEWHYVMKGPSDTPYSGGYYHGKLQFPLDFPFRPPAIYMLTPNGRFQTNKRLCLSISDFHPDNWNPTWSVSTILSGLFSFMLEDTPTYGSIISTSSEKKELANKSLSCNLKNHQFCELFPEICKEIQQTLINNSEEIGFKKSTKQINRITMEQKENIIMDEVPKEPEVGEKEVELKKVNLEENPIKRNCENGTGSEEVSKTTANTEKQEKMEKIDDVAEISLFDSWNYCTNFILICCFSLFMWIVHYVVKNA